MPEIIMENLKGCLLMIGGLALACIAAYIFDGLWRGLIYTLISIPWWLYLLAVIGVIIFKSKK